MKHQEKKYLVETFDLVLKNLHDLECKAEEAKVSTHFYASQPTNDVVKLVEQNGQYEIHILKESNGSFTLSERISLDSHEAGLVWLRQKGYQKLQIVKMAYTEFFFQEGIIGLYIINDFLHSVIIDFPESRHEMVANQLGLTRAEPINVPYNKYLEKLGKNDFLEIL